MFDEESQIIIEYKDYVNIKDKYKKILYKRIYYNFKINIKLLKFLIIIFLIFLSYNNKFFALNLKEKLITKFSIKDKIINNKINNITKIFESTNNINKNDSFINIDKNIYTFIDKIINKESLYNGNNLINNNIFKNNSYLLMYQNNIINNHINFNLEKNMNFTNNEFINIDNIKINITNEQEKEISVYKIISNELFLENETLNIKNIQEEIKNFKNKIYNTSFSNKEDLYNRINPKISIIITVYNQESYINSIYNCIQNQSLKDIEIIFVDDASIDNSFKQINELMKEDKRIKYIKNFINKGQFYSRYLGIQNAKGEYILVIDPDDLLLNNILIKAYKFAIHFNLDIVQYYHLKGNFTKNVLRKMNISGIFYNIQIKNIFFNCSYRYLWDKLIRREIFIESIEFIKEKYRNTRIIIHNDEVACFCVFRVAKSYGILEQIGYFYNRENSNSITKYNFKPENINGRFHTLFTIMEFYYEQSDNNRFEKTMGGYNFFELRINYMYKRKIKYLTNGFNYINNILDLYLNSPFFNDNQKKNLKKFKIKINKQKLKIFNLYSIY